LKSKSITVICCLIAAVFLFSGCSLLDFFAAEALLRAPKLTGENAALQEAFENSVGKDVSLFTPIAGDYRASYIFFDANGDNSDEAVVFYALNTNLSVIHIHLLARNGEEWYSVADITGSGTNVYKVDFFNIDTDGVLEVAVTWTVDDSKKEKTLSIYRITGFAKDGSNSLASVATVQMADYIYLDIDSDKVNELLYFYHNSSADSNQMGARLLEYSSGADTLQPVSDISLNERISSLLQIVYDRLGDDCAVYVDCLLSDGDYYTEIIYYDKELAVMSLPQDENGLICTVTERDAGKLCEDFNRDGQIDIPVSLYSENSYTTGRPEGVKEQIGFVSWQTYINGKLSEIGKYYDNAVDGYLINIDTLFDYYYFVYDYSAHVTQVRIKNFDEENNIEFTVKYDNKNDNFGNFTSTDMEDKYIISVTSKGKEMGISDIFVENLIINR